MKQISVLFLLLAFLGIQGDAHAGLATVAPKESINLVLGELEVYPVSNLTRLSLADPGIADIVDASGDEILIIAKSIGQTILFIWDDKGKRTVNINVFGRNLGTVQERLDALFKVAEINGVLMEKSAKEGKVILTGTVPDYKKNAFDQIVLPFSADIIDLTNKEEAEDLVQVDAQITELNTTLSKRLGFDWSTGTVGKGIQFQAKEDLPTQTGKLEDIFKIGDFKRTNTLLAAIEALVEEGEGRILSQPRLVVVSGQEASFLVGGEVPIHTTTANLGVSTQNVTFKDFGIGMTVTPTIKKGKVDIVLNLQIRDIDSSTASSVSEDVAFSTRTASTHLFLDDGQTIVMAGLIKKTESQTISGVPFLSKIPIAGMLFRKKIKGAPDQDQELVIALTPHIMAQKTEPEEEKIEKPATTTPVSLAEASEENHGLTLEEQKMVDAIAAAATKTMKENTSEEMTAPPSIKGAGDVKVNKPILRGTYTGLPPQMQQYIESVQDKISQAAGYPQEAREYSWEGTVKLNMLILSDGTLAFALIKESSGYEVFDEYALKATKSVAPFGHFPPETDLQEINITIPIVYHLN